MRGASKALVLVVGTLVVLFTAVAAGLSASSFSAFFVVGAIGIAILVYLSRTIENAGRYDMRSWLKDQSGSKFAYAYDGTGIAIDPGQNQVGIRIAGRADGEP